MILMRNELLVTASTDKSIKIWQWKDFSKARCIKTIDNAHTYAVNSLLELPGNILASGCYFEHIKFWDFNNDYKNFKTVGDNKMKTEIMILLNKNEIATTIGKYIKVYDIKTTKCLYTLTGHSKIILDLVLLDYD